MSAIFRLPRISHSLIVGLVILYFGEKLCGQDVPDRFTAEFISQIKPLVTKYCSECHSGADAEAEFDLEKWTDATKISSQLKQLQNFDSIIKSGQMPPRESEQLTDQQRKKLSGWSHDLLMFHARKHAGDPGPTLLRRLNNSEYNFTIQDLAGVPELDPTREFPVDGAAGEGFTNTGAAQAMSPALLQKYYDAAKQVANHVVLLPDRIEFSPFQSDRDRVDDYLKRIQDFYQRYSDNSGSSAVNLQGIRFETNGGGRLPLEKYLRATIQFRDRKFRDQSLNQFAEQNGLSAKYLNHVWQALQDGDTKSSLLRQIQKRWKIATLKQVPGLVQAITQWQSRLWKFNSIGHLGREAGPKQWMEPLNPVQVRQSFRIPVPESDSPTVSLYLGAKSLSGTPIPVRWIQPRVVFGKQNEILFRELGPLAEASQSIQRQFLADTPGLLRACHEVRQRRQVPGQKIDGQIIRKIATECNVQSDHLNAWLEWLGIHSSTSLVVRGHFQQKISGADGHDFIQGWGSHQTPSILANLSERQVRLPGIMKPKSVVVHPSPQLFSAVAWQSPVSGKIELAANIADNHPECGNGVQWVLTHKNRRRNLLLWNGEIEQGKSSKMTPRSFKVEAGDLITFAVGPRAGSHACDLTQINLLIKAQDSAKVWDLAKRLSSSILDGNPLSDSLGTPKVWHFFKGPWADVEKDLQQVSQVPAGSILDGWLAATDLAERKKFQDSLVKLINNPGLAKPGSPDAQLVEKILQMSDPWQSKILRDSLKADPEFSKKGTGEKGFSANDLTTETDKIVSFDIPTLRKQEAHVLVDVELVDPDQSEPVQVFAEFKPLDFQRASTGSEFLIANNPRARALLESSYEEFRKVFPAAICYQKIVPVDEVVTLTLFHRDDRWLRQLFLSSAETETLDRMWDELIYVSEEPLKKVVALEQIYQFATQDRPDLVKEFKKLFEPTQIRAATFRDRQIAARDLHLKSVLDFAQSAWRRPLGTEDTNRLRSLYRGLLDQEVKHESAIQLLVARVLVSPEFLYRRERTQPGKSYSAVSDYELATRLSYFLWSSTPDQELFQVALQGKLSRDGELINQASRMLDSGKIQRLATQFACQWLHLRDFDKNDDKNEELFPEFEKLREDMYGETVRFFEQLFRENRSILEIIDSDYMVLNRSMAQLYEVKFPADQKRWARVEHANHSSRGGILGMSTFLASQSGASRTSPILRGTWVSETLLGERLPKPPAEVPQLPELVPSGLTARELIEKHSSDAACAKCHRRIDPYGFALEQFDVMGRSRPRKMDTRTRLFDGTEIDGIGGLKSYILNQRRDDFVRQFCRKLLGFSLGREIQLSDEPLILDMMNNLRKNEYRFKVAIDTIVTSEQFRSIRNLDYRR